MKHFLHKLFLAVLLATGSICESVAVAAPFEVNGIFYEILSEADMTVQVCVPNAKPSNWYTYFSGMLNIPATIAYEGKTYTVEAIKHETFQGQRALTSVVIPKTVKTIGYRAFKGITGLKTIVFASDGALTTIEHEAFESSSISSLALPGSLTYIGEDAFKYCESLKSIRGGESLETLDKNAFQGCISLTEYTCPPKLKTIGDNAFWNCKSLRTVTMNDGLETIGNNAFLQCSVLENVNMGNTVKKIGWEAFRWCLNLNHIEIPNSVVDMDYGTFRFCTGLESIKLSNSLTKIPSLCFEQTAITSIDIPDGVNIIMPYAFQDCASLTTIHWGRSLETIGDNAFLGTAIKTLELPEPLKEIGGAAFAKCQSLTKVTIPSTVIKITDAAFSECSQLKEVNCLAITPPQIPYTNIPFSLCDNPVNVHIYEGLKGDYESSIGWSEAIQKNVVILIDDLPALKATSITIDQAEYFCAVGASGQATATIQPTNVYTHELSWSSSDETVLYIDEFTGMFVGLGEGTVTITATATDGSGVSATATVHVGTGAAVVSPVVGIRMPSAIYNLQGQQLQAPRKGINVINGKKVVIAN